MKVNIKMIGLMDTVGFLIKQAVYILDNGRMIRGMVLEYSTIKMEKLAFKDSGFKIKRFNDLMSIIRLLYGWNIF